MDSKPEHPFRLICVVGAPRSGTTLLQNLIATHPDVTTCPETSIFIQMSRTRLYHRNLPPWGLRPPLGTLPDGRAEALAAFLLERQPWVRPHELSSPWPAPVSPRAFTDRYLRAAMADPSRPVYLEKTPAHIHFVPTILSLYPDARIVHIVRNPFQIAQSYRRMLRLQGKPLRSTYEVTRIWKASLRMAQAHQLLTVRYEDLVADTGKEMERVGEYLGLAYSAALLARQHEQSRHSVLETESWKGNNYRGIQGISSSTPVSAEDRTVIGLCCGAEMARWGYDRPSGAGAPSSLLRQTLAYGLMRGQAMYAQWRTER